MQNNKTKCTFQIECDLGKIAELSGDLLSAPKLCFRSHPMTLFEFLNGMTQSLAWPVLISTLLFFYRKKITEFTVEMLGVKLRIKLVKEGKGPKTNTASLVIKNEETHYKLYSNGLLVQNVKLVIAPGIDKVPIVFPIAFPNELLSIQIVGDEVAWPIRTSCANCDLKISSSIREREIQIIISGI